MATSLREVHDYYRVEIPSDIDDPAERQVLAVFEAENRSNIWAVPCEWEVMDDDGHTVIVRRTRYAAG